MDTTVKSDFEIRRSIYVDTLRFVPLYEFSGNTGWPASGTYARVTTTASGERLLNVMSLSENPDGTTDKHEVMLGTFDTAKLAEMLAG